MKNPTCRWMTFAGMCRNIDLYSIVYFMPVFFLRNYPEFKTVYCLYNGLIISIAGICATLVSGLISDKYG